MNVKLQIKEVKEEPRELTALEEAVLRQYENMGGYGEPIIRTSRTETIRDATPEERMAWMFLNMVGEDMCPHCRDVGCGSCFLDKCIAHTTPRLKAKSKLYNKEVIVSLTEESI